MPTGSARVPTQARGKNRFLVAALALALGLLTVLTFLGVSRCGFTDLDDQDYVRENVHVNRGLNGPDILWAFTSGHACNWHPLTWLSHALDCQLYGLHPAGHHITNLIFHTANVILLFLLFCRMTSAPASALSAATDQPSNLLRSAFAAGLFALHPLHVESVAWISERKDVLSGFFFMLTLIAYVRYVQFPRATMQHSAPSKSKLMGRSPPSATAPSAIVGPPPDPASRSPAHSALRAGNSTIWYSLALFFFALGLMSKPMIVTLPFVLLLLDYWPLARVQIMKQNLEARNLARLVIEKLPFFALCAGSSLITMLVQKGSRVSLTSVSPWERLGNGALAYVAYLRQTFWPTRLAIFYPYPETVPLEPAIAAAAALISLTGLFVFLLFRASRRNLRASKAQGHESSGEAGSQIQGQFRIGSLPLAVAPAPLLVGWLWFLGMLVPVIGLVQVGTQARADRYTYLPSIGIFVMAAWGVRRAAIGRSRTERQELETERATQTGTPVSQPSSHFAHITPRTAPLLTAAAALTVLAALTFTTRHQLRFWRVNRALFQHAVDVVPNNYYALSAVGFYDLQDGDLPRALTNLSRSLQIEPDYPLANHHFGFALQKQRRFAEAIPYLRKAQVQPGLIPPPNLLLAISFMETGDFAEARIALEQAAAERPDYPDIPMIRAGLLFKEGNVAEAERLYRHTAAAHPGMPGPQRALAEFLVSQNRPVEAAQFYEAALKLQPSDSNLRQACAATLNNAAWFLATSPDDRQRDGKRAVEMGERACDLTRWETPVLMGTLAAAYAEAGRFEEAVAMAEKARDQARAQKEEEVAARNEELLKLYRAGKPYRTRP